MIKNSIIVMIINMLSRVFGLVREVLIAAYFGSTGGTDAYFASIKASNFFTTFLGTGSLGTILIPVYNEKRENEGVESANDFVVSIMNLLIVITSTISILTILFSKQILFLISNFKDPYINNLANNMIKIMAFYLLFIALVGVMASLLNNYKEFIISTSISIVFNIVIIAGIIISSKTIGIYGMAISFLLSGVAQFIYLLPSFMKIIKIYKPIFNYKDPYVKVFLIGVISTLFGIFGYQINEIIDNRFATSLPVGTVSAINYASRIYLLPVGVFAISLSTVIYPNLSESIVNKNYQRAKALIEKGMNLLLFLIIPSTIGLVYYAKEIIVLIYKNGKFSDNSVIITYETLQFYAIGLLFFSTIHLLTRGHYAFNDRKTPVIIAFVGIGTNIILDYLLYSTYLHRGLTFATSFSAMINFILLFISLKRKYLDINIFKYIRFFIMVSITSIFSLLGAEMVAIDIGKYTILIKIMIFCLIYFGIWGYPLLRKKDKIFE